MRLERCFFLSLYLSLAIAGVCLMQVSLGAYFFETALLAPAAALVLFAAYFAGGRWTLNTFWSTILGLIIMAGAGLYFADFLITLPPTGADAMTWASRFLPRTGLVLGVLLLVKLFRPKKLGDFWWLHLMGFVMVALASSLESDF